MELFPAWLAALLGVGILAAVMSTADGLVVSSSQIIANDLYRLSYVPKFGKHLDAKQVDRRVLAISRVATVAVMVICTFMAWQLMDRNVALIVWVGTGGMMAAFAAPWWWERFGAASPEPAPSPAWSAARQSSPSSTVP